MCIRDRFGGDKDGCRRDLLPRIGQKERICLPLGAERLRSGSFGSVSYTHLIGLREPFPVGDDHARDAAPAAEDTSAYRFLGHRMLRKQKQYERHRTSQTRKERIHK